MLESDAVAREADTEQEGAVEKQVDGVNKEEQKSDGKLILAEEIVEGRITWKSFKLYLDGLGGKHPFLIMAVWMAGILATQSTLNFGTWFLGYWGSQYETHPPEEVNVP